MSVIFIGIICFGIGMVAGFFLVAILAANGNEES